MADQLLTLLLIILAIGFIWSILKIIFKLTMKVFSCGLFLILIIGLLIFLSSNMEIF
ncbi:MAG: hypothetical protein ISR58_09790 [Anaerolineales bacterium]|nr:hypothetical protein [Chloroflexota bacterium]MBL6981466.1 hypothetical protein [Anaerolineales bacterium]